MPKCSECGSVILFGGNRDGDLRFCNDVCQGKHHLTAVNSLVPEDILRSVVKETHSGNCPSCGGKGPVDVHTSYRIWSALVLTSWNSRPEISCRSCGIKRKVGDILFCGFLGWWGFPVGVLMTPVLIGRNFLGIFFGPDPSKPSEMLEEIVKFNLAPTPQDLEAVEEK